MKNQTGVRVKGAKHRIANGAPHHRSSHPKLGPEEGKFKKYIVRESNPCRVDGNDA